MEKELAPSTPRIDLVLQYFQERCTPLLGETNRLCKQLHCPALDSTPASDAHAAPEVRTICLQALSWLLLPRAGTMCGSAPRLGS